MQNCLARLTADPEDLTNDFENVITLIACNLKDCNEPDRKEYLFMLLQTFLKYFKLSCELQYRQNTPVAVLS